MQVFLPGDSIPFPEVSDAAKLVLGPGIRRDGENLLASQCGVLRSHPDPPMMWLDIQSVRYVPVKGDKVIGIVTQRSGDAFKVEIGSAETATIAYTAFEGSTKKMRPNLKTGDIIYCQLSVAMKDMEPEVVCVDSEGKARGMGLLPNGGFVFKTTLSNVRRLLAPNGTVLKKLGDQLKFEVTCGLNGRVWVKSHSLKETVAICNVISKCEYLNETELDTLISESMYKLKGH